MNYSLPESQRHSNESHKPPVPPPLPPPLPSDKHWGDEGFNIHINSGVGVTGTPDQVAIDLESLAKPQVRMRTLNWRRIPKRRVLSHYTSSKLQTNLPDKGSTTTAPTLETKVERRRTTVASFPIAPKGRSNDSSLVDDSSDADRNSIGSDEEDANIWLLIAKSNKWIRKETPVSQHYEQPVASTPVVGVQPVSCTGIGGAAKIKEMLEAVRRRMSNVSNTTRTASNKSLASSCTGGSFLNQSSLSLLTNFDPSNQDSNDASFKIKKPKNIMDAIDFNELENLFCLSNQPNDADSDSPNFIRRLSMRTNASSDSVISSNSYLNQSNEDDDSSIEIDNILDSKKSFNVNIFLKQLKSPDVLIDLINSEDHSKIGKEKLENLLKLLPDKDETKQLMRVKQRNKQHKLPVAERFLLRLVSEVPNAVLRIKFMLLQEEYCTDMEAIRFELDKIERAAFEVRHSLKLRDILNLVLVTGNFLNSGGYAADAAGFGLDCLERLHEIRSNRPGLYLIHYVAGIANKLGLIDFQQSELEHVEPASRVCPESIRVDLCSMLNKICDLNRDTRIELNEQQTVTTPTTLTTTPTTITPKSHTKSIAIELLEDRTSRVQLQQQHHHQPQQQQRSTPVGRVTQLSQSPEKTNELYLMHLLDTLESIRVKVEWLRSRLTDLELTRKRLADYLCEDPSSFKLHDCFHNLITFSQRLKLANDENERRRQQEASSKLSNAKSSLKRSKTINTKLPQDRPISRQSVGGFLDSSLKDANPSSYSSYLSENMRRISIGSTDTNPKLLTSSPLRKHLTPKSKLGPPATNLNNSETKKSYDDLHEGLMRLLIETNGRRNPNRQPVVNQSNRLTTQLNR